MSRPIVVEGISVDEFPVLLRSQIAGSQKEYAKELGISVAFLSMLLSGRKPPSKRILDRFGLRREVRLVPASGTSGSAQDAQRLDPKGAGPTREAGDAQ